MVIVYFMQDKPVLFENPISQEEYMESLLFIGDSRTNGLGNYGFIKKENIYAVDGLSHIGAQTERFIKINNSKNMTIEEAIAIRQPERAMIGFGINGVGFMDEKTFINEYEKFLRSLKEKSPSTEFIVQSILPVSSGYERSNPEINNEKIDQYNEQLADLAEQLDMAYFNLAPAMKDEKNALKKEHNAGDGIHLSKNAYEVIVEMIKTTRKL